MSDEFNQLRRVRTKELGNLLLISDFYILGSGPGPGSGSGSGLGLCSIIGLGPTLGNKSVMQKMKYNKNCDRVCLDV